jgi:26S proteasome regulatory subunit N2
MVLQVFYHLGELDSALAYALGAGSHFNVNEQSEYVQTLVGEF